MTILPKKHTGHTLPNSSSASAAVGQASTSGSVHGAHSGHSGHGGHVGHGGHGGHVAPVGGVVVGSDSSQPVVVGVSDAFHLHGPASAGQNDDQASVSSLSPGSGWGPGPVVSPTSGSASPRWGSAAAAAVTGKRNSVDHSSVVAGEKRGFDFAPYDDECSSSPKRRLRGSGGGAKRHKGCPSSHASHLSHAVAAASVAQLPRPSGSPSPPMAGCSSASLVGVPGGGANSAGADCGGYNSEDEYSHLGIHLTEEEWKEKDRRFEKNMRKKGYVIRHMEEDGSCLFRAVADQIFGDQEMHPCVRAHCMDYISQNGDYFSQYVTEDFGDYVERKRYLGVHGNHLEIQALSEMYNRPIHIFCYSAEPINIFQNLHKSSEKINAPIRLTYHRGVHYNSLVDPYKATIGVGLGLPGHSPGAADRNLLGQAVRASEEHLVEKAMLEDKIKATDWEATNEAIEEQVARESYLQWLRDNERRNSGCSTSDGLLRQQQQQQPVLQQPAVGPAATVTSGDLRAASPKASGSQYPGAGSGALAQLSTSSMGSPRASCSSDRDSPKPGSSRQRSPRPSDGQSFPSGGRLELYNSATFLNGLPPNMFGLEDWSEADVLAQVLAASQQEYLDSLKKQKERPGEDDQPGCSGSKRQ